MFACSWGWPRKERKMIDFINSCCKMIALDGCGAIRTGKELMSFWGWKHRGWDTGLWPMGVKWGLENGIHARWEKLLWGSWGTPNFPKVTLVGKCEQELYCISKKNGSKEELKLSSETSFMSTALNTRKTVQISTCFVQLTVICFQAHWYIGHCSCWGGKPSKPQAPWLSFV